MSTILKCAGRLNGQFTLPTRRMLMGLEVIDTGVPQYDDVQLLGRLNLAASTSLLSAWHALPAVAPSPSFTAAYPSCILSP